MEDCNGKNKDVVISIKDKLVYLPILSKHYYINIYRVPKNLRQINEDAYRPMFVSIGPFYHKDPKLQPMQDHKLRYLTYFLRRDNIAHNNMGHYVNFIRERQQEIRNCYAEHIDLDDNTLVEMVFIDAAFIIELFLRYFEPFIYSDDRILGKPMMINEIIRDLRLEENQLPFFILDDLYDEAFENDHDRIPFVSLAYHVLLSKPLQLQHDIPGSSQKKKEEDSPERIKNAEIKHFLDLLRICHLPCTTRAARQQKRKDDISHSSQKKEDHDIPERIKNAEIEHFVDLLRICHLPCTTREARQQKREDDIPHSSQKKEDDDIPERIKNAKHFVDLLRICHLPCTTRAQQRQQQQQQPPSDDSDDQRTCPSVTKLSEAGVTFKARSRTSDDWERDLLHVTFTKGILEIPKIKLVDDTESLFRNIMVFEQCHHIWDSYIMDYFKFMDCLIDTTKDVEILIEKGIIENWLGSNEDVVNLFNNMMKQITRGASFYYTHICADLVAYGNNSWHRWWASLCQKYFNHPWAVISFVYAIVILILTVLQVISGFTKK